MSTGDLIKNKGILILVIPVDNIKSFLGLSLDALKGLITLPCGHQPYHFWGFLHP